jgi:hypothetical protein
VDRASSLLTLFVLLALAMIGCNTGGSTEDLEGTIVARVVATLEAAATEPAATQVSPDPTEVPTPSEPTATPEPPEPTATPAPLEPTVTAPPAIEAEEYAVYSAMIQENPIGYNLGSTIVIREQTMVLDAEMFERTLEKVDPLPARLVDSYRSRNAAAYTLDPNLDMEQDYVLLPRAAHDEIFRKRGPSWAEFESRYPESGGLVNFSRVGFSANGDKALVQMGFLCGDLCGAGGLYLLTKEEGIWKVQQSLVEWMS